MAKQIDLLSTVESKMENFRAKYQAMKLAEKELVEAKEALDSHRAAVTELGDSVELLLNSPLDDETLADSLSNPAPNVEETNTKPRRGAKTAASDESPEPKKTRAPRTSKKDHAAEATLDNEVSEPLITVEDEAQEEPSELEPDTDLESDSSTHDEDDDLADDDDLDLSSNPDEDNEQDDDSDPFSILDADDDDMFGNSGSRNPSDTKTNGLFDSKNVDELNF